MVPSSNLNVAFQQILVKNSIFQFVKLNVTTVILFKMNK